MRTVKRKFYCLGKKYNRLTAIESCRDHWGDTAWLCKCECGNLRIVSTHHLLSGKVKSCGCLSKEKSRARAELNKIHGMKGTREYKSWGSMKERCFCRSHKSYRDYGGRGITVCDRWKNSFLNFLNDMGKRPDGYSLERKNNDGNYEPSNCRWASWIEQARNRRLNTKLEIFGETKLICEWMEDKRCVVDDDSFQKRIKAGWDLEKALTMGKRVKSKTPKDLFI